MLDTKMNGMEFVTHKCHITCPSRYLNAFQYVGILFKICYHNLDLNNIEQRRGGEKSMVLYLGYAKHKPVVAI